MASEWSTSRSGRGRAGDGFSYSASAVLDGPAPRYGEGPAAAAAAGETPPPVPAGRIRKDEVIYLTNQLAIMLDTGVPLATALEGMIQQETNPALRRVQQSLKEAVESGEDFSAALAQHPKVFDSVYVSLVRASESTGSLGKMLDRIGTYLRKELELRGKVRAAMAYPMVMITIAVAVTIFLVTWVVPRFTPLFQRKGVRLPTTTQWLVWLSESMTQHWYLWIAGTIGLLVGAVFALRSPVGRQAWHYTKLHLPIVGPLFRKVALSRSIRTLGNMLSGGVPLLEALSFCRDVSGNDYYRQTWNRVLDNVTSGRQIHESLQGDPLIPPTLVQMIRAGEETANLGPILERVSGYYDDEVEQSVKAVTSMIEPIMITVMGIVVGGIGISLLLPIFTLSSAH